MGTWELTELERNWGSQSGTRVLLCLWLMAVHRPLGTVLSAELLNEMVEE